MPEKISIVIPVHDDKNNLKRCLASLWAAGGPGAEVIVVDDGSREALSGLLESFPFRLIKLEKNSGPAYARNVGVRASQGEIILFTDSDCVVMEGWAKRLAESLVRENEACPGVAAICGRLEERSGFWEQCHAFAGYGYVQGGPRRVMDFLNTACVAVYKEALVDVCGFSEDMRVSEDPELALKLVRQGYRIIFDPGVHVFHDHGIRSLSALWAKHYRWGQALGLKLVGKHPRRFPVFLPLLANPVAHTFLILPLAILTTIKIVCHNVAFAPRVLFYSPFIFISKIVYRWGIFRTSLSEAKKIPLGANEPAVKSGTDVSIIIVGTNEREHLARCLRSIAASPTKYTLETIVIDNASTDGTSDMVRRDFPGVRLIRRERRLGYIENNNFAMGFARGRYFLLLNSDIDLGLTTLETMVGFMDARPEAGVSACRLTFDDGDLQLTCRRFPTPLTYLCRLPHFLRWLKISKNFSKNRVVESYLMRDYDHQHTREVDWMLSAFFLLRRSAVDDIGMFSRWLVQPFYLEDMEWCFRAWVRGWKVYYVPEVSAVHFYRRGSVKKFSKLSLVHMANILIFFTLHAREMIFHSHRRYQTFSPVRGKAVL